jgi:carbonic anhydrase/acetyltransferase-like protein (isoleucine patch superfamily)
VLRGDMGPIRIGRDSNLQDGTICHDTTDQSRTLVGERVTVGHGSSCTDAPWVTTA